MKSPYCGAERSDKSVAQPNPNNSAMQTLDKILQSKNVCENFKREYADNEKFNAWIDGVLPEVWACFNQEQNTPWHIYNVMDHILHSVEEANKLSANLDSEERRLIAYTMFFHDLGKPEYHVVKEVNGEKSDAFTFHHLGSEKIIKRFLSRYPLEPSDLNKVVITLVREHDVFLKFSDNPAKDWQIKLTPENLKNYIDGLRRETDCERVFDYLVLVGLADNKAQNPAMTGESLALIERIGAMSKTL